MTTKIAKLDSTTVITTGLPASKPKPAVVIVTGPCIPAMQQVSQLVRMGYVPDSNLPLDFFGHTGAMSITMIVGSPDQDAIDAASQTLDDARAMEAAHFAREVEKAAARQIAAAAEVAAAARRAELIAEQRAALAKLEAELLSAPREALANLEKEAAASK
jgi:hypothetical protein